MTKHLLAIFLLLNILGCSSESVVDAGASKSTAPTVKTSSDEPLLILTASGAESFRFENKALYACTEDRIEIFTMTQAPAVRLALPLTISTGNYELIKYNTNEVPAPMLYVNGEVTKERAKAGKTRGAFYATPTRSSLTIENLPKETGDMFTATVNAELQSSDGDLLSVELSFKVLDSGYCNR